jgi:mannose-1-phosphate guanylyltransferase
MGGGIGSRFWPFSRKTMPKQFLDDWALYLK